MRQITVKYSGECKKCGAALDEGVQAMYEKSMGIFCIGCEPKDVEEIRIFRLEKAEKKAVLYEEWADKREVKANTTLNSHSKMRHDWAFITQPGYIPARSRMIRADDRALESLNVAKGFRHKANSLRHVRVAGDAERKRETHREKMDLIVHKGSRVHDFAFGDGEVIGVYSKSYRIKFDNGGTYARDKSYIHPLTEVQS